MVENYCFLDGFSRAEHNARIMLRTVETSRHTAAFVTLATACALGLLTPLSSPAQSAKHPSKRPATIYWCPDRPADQQIAAGPEPGCAPLVDGSKARANSNPARQKTLPPIKMEHIQSESERFMQRYNEFLECCADDVAELDTITDLEADATNILRAVQASGIYNAGTVVRQYTLGEIVRQVATSRRDLQRLRDRLERYAQGMDRLEGLDPETAARRARELESDREGIGRDFKPRRPAGSARTGVNIQDTTVPNWYGESPTPSSTLRSTTGADIGRQSDLSIRPGEAIRDTTLTDRAGPSAGDTSLPNSTGFGIGSSQNPGGSSTTPMRVGPDVGDSSLNR